MHAWLSDSSCKGCSNSEMCVPLLSCSGERRIGKGSANFRRPRRVARVTTLPPARRPRPLVRLCELCRRTTGLGAISAANFGRMALAAPRTRTRVRFSRFRRAIARIHDLWTVPVARTPDRTLPLGRNLRLCHGGERPPSARPLRSNRFPALLVRATADEGSRAPGPRVFRRC